MDHAAGAMRGRASRRAWVGHGRAHIEVRGLQRPGSEDLAASLKRALERVRSVRWAEINAALGRVVVAFDEDEVDLEDLVGVIEGVEEAHRVNRERFPHDRPEHPADVEPLQRNLAAIAADLVGIGVSISARAIRAVPIPTELAALVSFVDTQPRLRRLAVEVVGPPAADLGLALGTAISQGLGQGPLGLAVDLAHRANLVGEIVARRRVWMQREPELHRPPRPGARQTGGGAGADVPPIPTDPRPVPLPPGPVEQWADRTSLASLGAFGVAFATTRDFRRAASLTLAGMPKAGRLGREAFAAHLGRVLAARGVVPFDPACLRRLDRVDTVMVESGTLLTGRNVIGRVIPLPDGTGRDPTALEARAQVLYMPERWQVPSRRGTWVLGPLEAIGAELPRGARARAARESKLCEAVLGLAHRGRLVALVTVEAELDPLSSELVAAIRRSGHLFAVAGRKGAVAERLGADRRTPTAKRLLPAVRTLQLEGRVVMLLATTGGAALRAADCGVGILAPPARPPWGAGLICGPGLAAACLLVEATAGAGRASQWAAGLAVLGSAVGGAVAMSGPKVGAARRAQVPVNGAALAAIAAGAWEGMRLGRRPDPVPEEATQWHALPAEVVARTLGTSPQGLDAEEARRRRSGSSWAATGESLSLPAAIVDELVNPLTPILAVASGLSAATGSPVDAGLVGGVVGGSALFSALHTRRTAAALQSLVPADDTRVRVRRSGETVTVSADRLVRGDVVVLESGEVVPADLRILEASSLEVDESSLTGESLPVAKTPAPTPGAGVAERSSMLYEGTTIAAGTAVGAVVALWPATEIGRSLSVAGSGPGRSGVYARLGSLTKLTVPLAFAGGLGLTGNGLARGRNVREAVGSGVSLGVAAVPEGLPVVANAAALAGARRLSRRGALVGNPAALEALGSVDVLCFDKTGTLTEGRLNVRLVSDGSTGQSPDRLEARHRAVLAAGLRASPSEEGGRPPHATDRAVLRAAKAAGIGLSDGLSGWRRLEELPFEPARGFHVVVGETGTSRLTSVKGAPERVLARCTSWRSPEGIRQLDTRLRRDLEAQVERLAARGLRVLAVGEKEEPQSGPRPEEAGIGLDDLVLLGFLAIADEPRGAAPGAVAALGRAGVSVRMVTGDHPATAAAVAEDLGILNGGRILTGGELDEMEDAELDALLPDVSVFARVTPAQKVRIVEALQRSGRRVAMTGDGANDAPAIRLAQVGFAVGDRATPAAREAADVVIAGNELETIIDAIVEGRAMWVSLRDALAILVGGNLGEIGFELTGSALTGNSPLNARQLLLTNLLTDLGPALAIAMQPPRERPPEELLREGPEASLGSSLTRQIVLRAVTTAAGATGAWLLARPAGRKRASTIGLAALVGTQLGQTLVAGGRSPLVVGTVLVSGAALVLVVETPGVSGFFGCTPLGPAGWATAAGAATAATCASVALPWAASRVGRILGAPGKAGVPTRPDGYTNGIGFHSRGNGGNTWRQEPSSTPPRSRPARRVGRGPGPHERGDG